MTESTAFPTTKRYAVVTGGNKGIGLEICRQMASKDVTVVLGSRDEKRGAEAVDKLKEAGLSGHVVFHQLDVSDPDSIASFADFVKTQFGKLDILVNNAGIGGVIMYTDAFRAATANGWPEGKAAIWNEITTQTFELAEECLKVNYYGAKRMTEALLPLLELSDSPRIVNVSSDLGRLENLPHGWAKELFSDIENLTEEKVDETLNKFLEDFKEGSLENKGWPSHFSAYKVSKVAMNAYTRILAKKHPSFYINCVAPGFVKTDIVCNSGLQTAAEGAEAPVSLALLPDGGPSGLFYCLKDVAPF